MPPGDITLLIADWQRGDRAAEDALFEALYQRLHTIAVHCLQSERRGQSMGATGLIHEAYLRFRRSERLEIQNRGHFLALTARVMRRVLVDRARNRRAAKRGAEARQVELEDSLVCTEADADEILIVDRALESLAAKSKRLAQLVELRYFAGYSQEESALAMGVAERTVRRDWEVARARLRSIINGESPSV